MSFRQQTLPDLELPLPAPRPVPVRVLEAPAPAAETEPAARELWAAVQLGAMAGDPDDLPGDAFPAALSVLVALYGLYLFYVGLPHVMKTPEEQRLPYLGVVLVVSIVVWFVLMGLPALMVGGMIWMNG